MISVLKFSIYFTVSFLILSIPINQSTLFSYINGHTAKYTTPVYASAKNHAIKGIKQGKQFAKKLFSNSTPSEKELDRISTKYSGAKKEYPEFKLPADSYTVEERELVRKLTTNNK